MLTTLRVRTKFPLVALTFSCFCLSSIFPAAAHTLELPPPGTLVFLSAAYNPVLLKGLEIHPEDPLRFDFIVNPGDERLTPSDLKASAQRMVNYFLATLAIPAQDLWVNLSPVEKDRIIPDALVKTELGRDLLAQDYMLKQVASSLIYPDSGLGRKFWDKVYAEAHLKFGVTDVPLSVLNKVWIVPEKAAVIQRSQSLYITATHLKVMLEEDYLANRLLGQGKLSLKPSKDISSRVMREVIVPALEREVNEGKNFSRLRQIFYTMILAQWYQDAFRQAVLNKSYAGTNKVKGIDRSEAGNKEKIYQQYMKAYKVGAFHYIKQEMDRLKKVPVPKKYFSGGFKNQRVRFQPGDFAMAYEQSFRENLVEVQIGPVAENLRPEDLPIAPERWRNELKDVPMQVADEIRAALLQHTMRQLMDRYNRQFMYEVRNRNPVQGAWPFLKAVKKLTREERMALTQWVREPATPQNRLTQLVYFELTKGSRGWAGNSLKNLKGYDYYFLTLEMDLKEGGLGPVNVTHTRFLKEAGIKVKAIQPKYEVRFDTGVAGGEPVQYIKEGKEDDKDLGYRSLKRHTEFEIQLNGKPVRVQVWRGINRWGVETDLLSDIQRDGSSYYTHALYHYEERHNQVTKEESMAFFNIAAATWMSMQRNKKFVYHYQDGQMAPFGDVLRSRFPELSNPIDQVGMFSSHTILNVGDSPLERRESFLQDMLGIQKKWRLLFETGQAFDQDTGQLKRADNQYLHHTRGAMDEDIVTGVSLSHAELMGKTVYNVDMQAVSNGVDSEQIAWFFRESVAELKAEGKINHDADIDELAPEYVALAKARAVEKFNKEMIVTANGEALFNYFSKNAGLKSYRELSADHHLVPQIIAKANEDFGLHLNTYQDLIKAFTVQLDPDSMTVGYARRLVIEKNHFDPDLVEQLVTRGYTVVFMGKHQGKASEQLSGLYRQLEMRIRTQRALEPDRYKGEFYFVEHFNDEQKVMFLGAANAYLMLNKRYLGANEVAEEFMGDNYLIQIAFDHRDGGTTDWLIPIDFKQTGLGSLLMLPYEGPQQEWLTQGFDPLMALWNRGEQHLDFYRHALESARMGTIMRGPMTVAAYLWLLDDLIDQRTKHREEDWISASRIATVVGPHEGHLRQLLYETPGHMETSYSSQGLSIATPPGLDGFLAMIKTLETNKGAHALHAELDGYGHDLISLFAGVPEAQNEIRRWVEQWEAMEDVKEKNKRFQSFLEKLRGSLFQRIPWVEERQVGISPLAIKIANAVKDHKEALRIILHHPKGITPFRYNFADQEIEAADAGIDGFLGAMKVIMAHNELNLSSPQDHFVDYLKNLFSDLPGSLKMEVYTWLNEWSTLPKQSEESIRKGSINTQSRQILAFLQDLVMLLGAAQMNLIEYEGANSAMRATGGVDFRGKIGQVGDKSLSVPTFVTNRYLESMISNASGLQGTIVSITPLSSRAPLFHKK